MILTTTETISGRNLATLGLVQGNTIQSSICSAIWDRALKLWLAASLNHTLK